MRVLAARGFATTGAVRQSGDGTGPIWPAYDWQICLIRGTHGDIEEMPYWALCGRFDNEVCERRKRRLPQTGAGRALVRAMAPLLRPVRRAQRVDTAGWPADHLQSQLPVLWHPSLWQPPCGAAGLPCLAPGRPLVWPLGPLLRHRGRPQRVDGALRAARCLAGFLPPLGHSLERPDAPGIRQGRRTVAVGAPLAWRPTWAPPGGLRKRIITLSRRLITVSPSWFSGRRHTVTMPVPGRDVDWRLSTHSICRLSRRLGRTGVWKRNSS